MTKDLFRDDAYLQTATATVTAINDRGGILLDQTIFYPTGGGQPGDSGYLELSDGSRIEIATTVKGESADEIVHVPAEGQALPEVGASITMGVDWERRHRLMRMHTAMHLTCSVIPCGVTGGQVGEEKSRLDFDLGDHTVDKLEIEAALNRLIQEAHDVGTQWITDEELDQNPDLVRTMSVQPPRGAGKIRLLKIGEAVDLQPCGGTHVKNTQEIIGIKVGKIENKGKKNRRIHLLLQDEAVTG